MFYEIKKNTAMKLFSVYQSLKRKSVELLSQGYLNEYFETLMELSSIEKQIATLSQHN
jgi:hypothetical protein